MPISVLYTAKTYVIGWDTNVVQGAKASISAARPDGAVLEEKKNVKNDGEAPLSFPTGYWGECYVVVRGSTEGEEEGTFTGRPVNGNGQWKWAAGILAALIIGALPGCVAFWRAPTKDDFDQVQANQQRMLQAIAVLETQNIELLKAVEDARNRIILLQTGGR